MWEEVNPAFPGPYSFNGPSDCSIRIYKTNAELPPQLVFHHRIGLRKDDNSTIMLNAQKLVITKSKTTHVHEHWNPEFTWPPRKDVRPSRTVLRNISLRLIDGDEFLRINSSKEFMEVSSAAGQLLLLTQSQIKQFVRISVNLLLIIFNDHDEFMFLDMRTGQTMFTKFDWLAASLSHHMHYDVKSGRLIVISDSIVSEYRILRNTTSLIFGKVFSAVKKQPLFEPGLWKLLFEYAGLIDPMMLKKRKRQLED